MTINKFNFAIYDLKTQLFWFHLYKSKSFLSGFHSIGVPKNALN